MPLAHCTDGLFAELGSDNWEKRVETNFRCTFLSSTRRRHVFFLCPQRMVPLCAEFSVLQGNIEDIFNGTSERYGFSCLTEFTSLSGDLQLLLLLQAQRCVLSRLGWKLWQVQAASSCTAASQPRCSCPCFG